MPSGMWRSRIKRLEQAQPPRGAIPRDGVALLQAHGITPDGWQRDALRSTATRQLWCCARQTGKSLCVSAMAWQTALSRPKSLILLVAPSLRQSSELMATVHSLKPPAVPVLQRSALRLTLANRSRIIALPGLEETIRGFSGVTLLVLDEAARIGDELYHAVRPMVAIGGGTIIGLSTPWGQRGWFYESYVGDEDWERTMIVASACPRISTAFLDQERRVLPRLFYESEYECRFAQSGEGFFNMDDVAAAFFDDDTEPWEPTYGVAT